MRRIARLTSFAVAVATSVALVSCSSGSSSDHAGGPGVDAGATKEQYLEAFKDVETTTINSQTPNPKGSVAGRYIERYQQAVEDWSGGKVKFDTVYSSAVAGITEIDTALGDGRLDISQIYPSYQPQEYPINTALTESAVISDFSVVNGLMSANGWGMDQAFSMPDLSKEFEDRDMKVLVPYYTPGPSGLFCTKKRTTLDQLKGAMVGAGGAAQITQLKSLGTKPASLPFSEMYEGLQRGIVDCAVSSLNAAVNSGLAAVAPQTTLDPANSIVPVTGAMVMSTAKWQSLPLLVQQLLWDRLDVFMAEYLESNWEVGAQLADDLAAKGGGFSPFGDDAREDVKKANASLVTEASKVAGVGDDFTDQITEKNSEWVDIVGGLGYTNPTDYNGFGGWFEPSKVDSKAYVDALMKRVYTPHRPS